MADEAPKTPTVVEAETVIIAENTPAQETLAAAEARADNAERVAEEIADAARNSAIVDHVEGEIEECRTETQQAQSAAEDAHARLTMVETNLSSMQTTLSAQTGLLEAMALRLEALTPPQSSPNPTPETEAEADPLEVVAEVVPEVPVVRPRQRRYRLM